MARETDYGIVIFRTAANDFTIAAVFRCQYLFTLYLIIIAIGPTEMGAFRYSHELFGRKQGTLVRCIAVWPKA